jgi:hypothetical protein
VEPDPRGTHVWNSRNTRYLEVYKLLNYLEVYLLSGSSSKFSRYGRTVLYRYVTLRVSPTTCERREPICGELARLTLECSSINIRLIAALSLAYKVFGP